MKIDIDSGKKKKNCRIWQTTHAWALCRADWPKLYHTSISPLKVVTSIIVWPKKSSDSLVNFCLSFDLMSSSSSLERYKNQFNHKASLYIVPMIPFLNINDHNLLISKSNSPKLYHTSISPLNVRTSIIVWPRKSSDSLVNFWRNLDFKSLSSSL